MSTHEQGPRPGGSARLAGREVARIGYGAMQLERLDGDHASACRVLRRAVELGVDHVDTAQFYGDGLANRLLREALAPYADGLVLVSKVGAERAGTTLVPSQRPERLRAQVEANLVTLGVERLDVVNLRRMDARPGIVAEGEQLVDLDSQLAEMVVLRGEGKIGGIGLSNVSVRQLEQSLPAGIACVQNAYSALDRTAEPVHDLCREHEVAWVPFFPLGSAFPGTPQVNAHPDVVAVARRLGATPTQVGLAWLLAQDPHTLLIPGTAGVAHLEENLAAGDLRLDEDAVSVLERLA